MIFEPIRKCRNVPCTQLQCLWLFNRDFFKLTHWYIVTYLEQYNSNVKSSKYMSIYVFNLWLKLSNNMKLSTLMNISIIRLTLITCLVLNQFKSLRAEYHPLYFSYSRDLSFNEQDCQLDNYVQKQLDFVHGGVVHILWNNLLKLAINERHQSTHFESITNVSKSCRQDLHTILMGAKKGHLMALQCKFKKDRTQIDSFFGRIMLNFM